MKQAGRHRAACALALLLAATAASGCTQLLSIGSRAVVVGMGVDRGPGSDVTVSIQMYHHGGPTVQTPGGGVGGGGQSSASQPTVFTLTGSGPGLVEAVASAQAQTDVFVSFWATDLLMLGEGLAGSGLRAALDPLLRSGEFALPAQVAVVSGTAGAALQIKSAPGGSALEISRELARSDSTDLGPLPIDFGRFMARLATPYRAAWAPVIAVTQQGYASAGTAVFRDDRLAAVLDPAESAVLSWLIKGGGYSPLNFTSPGGARLSLRVVRSQRRLTVAGPDSGSIEVTLDTQPEQATGVSLASAATNRALQAEAAAAATADLREVVGRLQAAGSDVVGFGELVRERDPAAVTDWPATFAHMAIRIDVTVHVRPAGRLS